MLTLFYQQCLEQLNGGVTMAGVGITTRQLAKCEWNLDLASHFFYLLASLASCF
jgi:hypothetical protein